MNVPKAFQVIDTRDNSIVGEYPTWRTAMNACNKLEPTRDYRYPRYLIRAVH